MHAAAHKHPAAWNLANQVRGFRARRLADGFQLEKIDLDHENAETASLPLGRMTLRNVTDVP